MVTLCFFIFKSLIYCYLHHCVAYMTSLFMCVFQQTEHLKTADLTFNSIPFLYIIALQNSLLWSHSFAKYSRYEFESRKENAIDISDAAIPTEAQVPLYCSINTAAI
jgi:hypothetical protein